MNWRLIYAIALGLCLGFAINNWLELRQINVQLSQQNFTNAVAKAAPAVVNIYSSSLLDRSEINLNWHNFIDNQNEQTRIQNSLGSGVIISPEGYIVTTLHIVDQAQEILILLADGRELQAKVIGRDDFHDIAILKIDSATDLPQIEIADPNTTFVGEIVLAIGNPFGLGQSVSQGIISGLSRKLVGDQDRNYIQTDAAINPGNSGGALINTQGQLLGLNSRIVDNNGFATGIGFAIPVDTVLGVLNQIIKYGKPLRPWFGFYAQIIWDPKFGNGLYINAVEVDSPAFESGLAPGDIVLAINEQPLPEPMQLQQLLLDSPIGTSFNLKVLRQRSIYEKKITSIGKDEISLDSAAQGG